jgi:protein subunit release factor A
VVRTAQTRSRKNSLANAMTALTAELDRLSGHATGSATNGVRRQQVGSGMRSDKRRTLRFREGVAHDHITHKSAPLERMMKGEFHLLW